MLLNMVRLLDKLFGLDGGLVFNSVYLYRMSGFLVLLFDGLVWYVVCVNCFIVFSYLLLGELVMCNVARVCRLVRCDYSHVPYVSPR